METRPNSGAVAVGATALGVTAVAFGVAGLLAFGPRHDVTPTAVEHHTGKPGCSMFCDEPAPATHEGSGCTLFCSEPGLPAAKGDGCQLFCEFDAPKEYPR